MKMFIRVSLVDIFLRGFFIKATLYVSRTIIRPETKEFVWVEAP